MTCQPFITNQSALSTWLIINAPESISTCKSVDHKMYPFAFVEAIIFTLVTQRPTICAEFICSPTSILSESILIFGERGREIAGGGGR